VTASHPRFFLGSSSLTLGNTVIPQTSKDKLYLGCLVAAMVAGMYFSLNSVGYLLGFNATTLALYGIVFTVTSLNWIVRAKPMESQLVYSGLVVVPIATRIFFNMPLFEQIVASTAALEQLSYMAQVLGIWLMVAVCEESFRATMMNTAIAWMPAVLGVRGLSLRLKLVEDARGWDDLTAEGKAAAMVFTCVAWIAFHFLQRPLDFQLYWRYMIWLFVSGITFGYALVKAGPGCAVVIHVLTNLTA